MNRLPRIQHIGSAPASRVCVAGVRAVWAGALGVAVWLGGCLDASGPLAVDVHPRVVLDGTIELSDRTQGRLVINEVLAHAPSAMATPALAGAEALALLTDDDALLFRYDAQDRTGFGALVDGARSWSLPPAGATLRVAFQTMPADVAEGLSARSGVSLVDLVGHTAVVRGTIALPVRDGRLQGFDGRHGEVDPDGSPAIPGNTVGSTDPDGAPANPGARDEGQTDPDGAPAAPDNPAADTSSTDPDGAPATPAQPQSTDPDGAPAKPGAPRSTDPDGAPATVDPDGSPAVDHAHAGRMHGKIWTQKGPQTMKGAQTSGSGGTRFVAVPFTIFVDEDFQLDTLLAEDAVLGFSPGEVIPLTLHLALTQLFSPARIAELEALAAEFLAEPQTSEGVTLEVHHTSQRVLGVKVDGGAMQAPDQDVRVTSGRISVSGDLRR